MFIGRVHLIDKGASEQAELKMATAFRARIWASCFVYFLNSGTLEKEKGELRRKNNMRKILGGETQNILSAKAASNAICDDT